MDDRHHWVEPGAVGDGYGVLPSRWWPSGRGAAQTHRCKGQATKGLLAFMGWLASHLMLAGPPVPGEDRPLSKAAGAIPATDNFECRQRDGEGV